MNNIEFGKYFEKRTRDFAVDLINFCISLSGNPEIRSIKNQVSRSGTSIGANYREANRARSRADFVNKVKISLGEASETVYWLEVLYGIEDTDKVKIAHLLKESKEILAMLNSICHKLWLKGKGK